MFNKDVYLLDYFYINKFATLLQLNFAGALCLIYFFTADVIFFRSEHYIAHYNISKYK